MLDQRLTPNESTAPTDQRPQEPTRADAASPRRRNLLKAAASAVPLVATLPSGEALAQASALQCVINEQNGTKEQPEGEETKEDPLSDSYARIAGTVESWFINNPNNPSARVLATVYHIVTDSDEIHVYGDNQPGLNLPVRGTWFDSSVAVIPSPLGTSDAVFLYAYEADRSPIEEKEDVHVDTSTGLPTSCIIDPAIPPWPGPTGTPSTPAGPSSTGGTHCFYPLAVQAPSETPGNVPLTYSCLASFQRTV